MSRRKGEPKPQNLPAETEAEIVDQVLDACKILGLAIERPNTGAAVYQGTDGSKRHVRFGEAGDSDFRGTLPGGRRLGLEIKRPGQKPTPEQYRKLHQLNEAGAVGMWTDAPDLFLKYMPVVIAGGRAEIDEAGICWITDEPRKDQAQP